jgi:hypothetical protein
MPLYADNLDKRHHPSPVGAKGRTSRTSYRGASPPLVAVPATAERIISMAPRRARSFRMGRDALISARGEL